MTRFVLARRRAVRLIGPLCAVALLFGSASAATGTALRVKAIQAQHVAVQQPLARVCLGQAWSC